jgi:hypothetical protein
MVMQFELVWMTVLARARALQRDPDRGDGILIWVVMTALLATAAVIIVGLIVTSATQKAHDVQTTVK